MKITMVGGGSYTWSPKLICDIMHEDSLSGSEIVLLDINPKAAEDVKAAMEKIAADNNKKFKFVATSNEDDALRDADVILITISTGGFTTMRPDVELPERYGIFQSVGDTVGPGGWSRTLRNVPVFEKLAKKIEKIAPKAFVLNYSNPMAALTGVFSAVTPGLKALGLCHGPVGTMHYLAKIFDVDVKRIFAKFGGVNHFFWITEFTVDGKDGYKLLREKLNGAPLLKYDKSYMDPDGVLEFDHVVLNDIFMNLGYLSYSADNHTAEFLPGYLLDLKTIAEYKIARKSIAGREESLDKAKQVVRDMAAGKVPMPEKSCEVAVDVMKAIKQGTTYCDVVNLPNIGQIENLSRGAVVETLGIISPTGFSPVAIGKLPEALRGITEPHCHIQLMTLEAALTGNKKLALEALALDPLCGSLTLKQIRQMGEELMNANAAWLPQFN